MTGDSGYDPATVTHRALREIRRELERHPAVAGARGFPPDGHARVEAELRADRLGSDAEGASLTVRWFAGERATDRPRFSVHYSDDTGTDFGWHHEPNPHVDGWGHFQRRTDTDDAYVYEPYSFSTHVPSRVIWEVLSMLEATIDELQA